MDILEVIFWICLFLVFYTYIGYGMVLYVLVKAKEWLVKPRMYRTEHEDLPQVTLLIAAYNEELVVADKMTNCIALRYPADKLRVVWVTDGSTDATNQQLSMYPDVTVLFEAPRRGKTAALNRAMSHISTPLVVYTDANTMLCTDAVMEIVQEFANPSVGCVAGEKRVAQQQKQGATAGEGIYWRYESLLKELDYRLYSAVGAAGELFAIRTALYVEMSEDTLLDDFVLSLRIAQRGYKIAYCKRAYAIESASADMKQEGKRKVRIAAGGLQAIGRLGGLFNVFRHGALSFQYLSHRVLRWSVTPLALFGLLPLNMVIVIMGNRPVGLYGTIMVLQSLFYALGLCGYLFSNRALKSKIVFVPYYFIFMNVSVIKGVAYLVKHRGSGVWEKATRV